MGKKVNFVLTTTILFKRQNIGNQDSDTPNLDMFLFN